MTAVLDPHPENCYHGKSAICKFRIQGSPERTNNIEQTGTYFLMRQFSWVRDRWTQSHHGVSFAARNNLHEMLNAAIASKGFRRHRWTRKIKKANLPNLRFPAFSFQDQQSASMTRCEQAPNLPSLQGPKMAKADGSPQTCAVKKLRQPRAREQAQSALSEKDNLKPTPEPHVNIANIRLQRQTYKLNQINPTYIPVKCMIDTSTNPKYEPKMTPLLHPAWHRYFVHHAKSLLHTWKILEATQWHQDASNLMSTWK